MMIFFSLPYIIGELVVIIGTVFLAEYYLFVKTGELGRKNKKLKFETIVWIIGLLFIALIISKMIQLEIL